MTVLTRLKRSARAVLCSALCLFMGMLLFAETATAEQAGSPRVVILGKCALDFDACFNVCQMTYPEGTSSWQRGQYACGQQCVAARSRCEGHAGLGQVVKPAPQQTPQQSAPRQVAPQQTAPQPKPKTQAQLQPQRQVTQQQLPQRHVPKQTIPRQRVQPRQVPPRQVQPSRPEPIDPDRRIPFSTDAQIAESQQGTGGFDQSPEVRARRADIREGWYIGAGGGMSIAENADNRKSNDTFITDVDPKVIGFALSGVVGMKLWKNVRAEGEVLYASNQLNELNVITAGSSGLAAGKNSVDGDLTSLAVMVNGYYDFPILDDFTPYLMAGVGGARIGLENVKAAGTERIDDSAFVFAYQLGLGISFPIGDDIAIDGGYRFFNTLDPNLQTKGGDKFDTQYLNHRLMLSARYLF
jgi:opacity protein-like surface antigen